VADRRLGAVAVIVVALVVVAGLAMWWWRGDSPGSMPVASVQGAQLERTGRVDPGVADAVRSGVTRVFATGCGESRQATATLVDLPDGPVALTNQHVVAGTDVVRLDGQRSGDAPDAGAEAEVADRVANRDAVRLDPAPLEDSGVEPLAVGPQPITGSSVVVAGYPGGRFEARVGHVVRVERRQGYGGTVDMLIVDVQAIPGISGGVVVDGEGRAVGLVAARDPESGDTVAYPIGSVTGATTGATLTCGEH
jgi:hypothetical protein